MKKSKSVRVISLYKMKMIIKSAIRTFSEDNISLYAAESAFYIILSVVPFLLLLFTAARLIIPDGMIDYMYSFADHFPSAFGDFFKEEIESLSKRPTPAPFSISLFGVLWSSSRGIRAVRRGIRSVYGASDISFLKELFGGMFMTVVFIVLIAAVLVFLVFGNKLGAVIADVLPSLHYVTDTAITVSPLIFSVFLVLFFTFVFRAFSPRDQKIHRYRDHFPGALTATIGWILYSYIFSLFVNVFSDMSYIYGSLAALMILMIWLYMIMNILFIGAEINKYMLFRKETRK